jgi:hypothetical protein
VIWDLFGAFIYVSLIFAYDVDKDNNTNIRLLWPFYLIYVLLNILRIYRFALFNRGDSKLNRKYLFWTYNFSTIIFMILYTIHMIIYAAEYDFDLILFSCLLFNIILLSYFTLVAR